MSLGEHPKPPKPPEKNKGCSKCKKRRKKCTSCACRVLKETEKGTNVKVVTDSGNVIEGKFVKFRKKDCCVKIKVPEMVTLLQPASIVFIDCNKIESVSFPA